MSSPNLILPHQTGALGAILRPCKVVPRPIPCPPEHQIRPIGSQR
jgi:hypothetical protein